MRVRRSRAEALNLTVLDVADKSISPGTPRRHSKPPSDSGLIKKIFDALAPRVDAFIKLEPDAQRLDSAHVRTNMAHLSRIELFRRTVTTFLKFLRSRPPEAFKSVELAIWSKYLKQDDSVADAY